jgi:RHS repeat-associated protein
LAGLGGGHTYTLAGASSATRTWAYDFSAASSFEGTIPVTATDRATNEGTASFTLVRDGTPPAVAVTATVQAEDIHVTWSAADTGSDLNTCSLEVDTGDGSPEELSTSCEGSRIYTEAEPGQTCIFHLTATDNVGNQASAQAASGLPRVTKYFYHGGQRVAMRSGGQVFYLHGDHLGSVSLVTDAEGNEHARTLFYPYGDTRYTIGESPTDLGFGGQKVHADLGLVYMRARYYHAALGRFVSGDAVVPEPGNPQSLNRFSYVLRNPLRYIDADGHRAGPPRHDGGWAPGSAPSALDVTPTPTPSPTPSPTYTSMSSERTTVREVFGDKAFWEVLRHVLLDSADMWRKVVFGPTREELRSGWRESLPESAHDELNLVFFAVDTVDQGLSLAMMTTPVVYRGGIDLTPRLGDVRIDKTTGLLRPTHGVSVFDDLSLAEPFGGAYQVEYLPEGLKIQQRGQNLHHYEIMPAEPMTFEAFAELLQQVVLVPAK